MNNRIVILISIFMFVAGCSSVRINSPDAGETIKPNQTFIVEIDDDADASSFKVTINNTDVTDLFEPKPYVAGVTVVAQPIPASYLGQGDELNYIEAYADWENASWGGAFTSKTQGKHFNLQRLNFAPVDDSTVICELNCAYGVKEGQTVEVEVYLPQAPQQNTEVIVHPKTNHISLNNAPAGDDITLVIPNNDRRIVFDMRGIAPTGNIVSQWSMISVSAPNTRGSSYYVRVLP